MLICADRRQPLGEIREADRQRLGALDADALLRADADDRPQHGDAVVAGGLRRGRRAAGAGRRAPRSRPRARSRGRRTRFISSTTVRMRSDSLTRSSPAPRMVVVPRAKLASSTSSGNSSISAGTISGSMSVATSSAGRTSMSATGSPAAQRRPNRPTRAPIRSSAASRPVRVGLIEMFRSVRFEPWRMVAAAMNGAADEKSPGTGISGSTSSRTGEIEIRPGRRSTGTPARCSIRSVWSRVAIASSITVTPRSANRPANSRQDLTWADATGGRYSIGVTVAGRAHRHRRKAIRRVHLRRPSSPAGRRSAASAGGGCSRRRPA